MEASSPLTATGIEPTVRCFRIAIRHCKKCGREWPARLDSCASCAATLGPVTEIACTRMVAPPGSLSVAPALAAVLAIELVKRGQSDNWQATAWKRLLDLGVATLHRFRGCAGTLILAWPLNAGGVEAAAEFAIALDDSWPHEPADQIERRGSIALGVITGNGSEAAVVRDAERLALSAQPGQWLCGTEIARRLRARYQFRPSGQVPRWEVPVLGTVVSFRGRLDPPRMPSAITSDAPIGPVLGREHERQQILAELRARGRHHVVLVSAEAGGGKSALLRSVLADAGIRPSVGVAFPPLGGGLDSDLSERLSAALDASTVAQPGLIVIDDLHWADPRALEALRRAITRGDRDRPVTWLLIARTAELPRLAGVVALADVHVRLPPLPLSDRVRIVESHLGEVSPELTDFLRADDQRGNPLYLEHLAAAITEGGATDSMPGDLHEAVLARLDHLAARARALTRSFGTMAQDDPRQLDRQLADWLDRLETTDIADLETIGRYLSKLRMIDFELRLAHWIKGIPVDTNRRLTQTIERLAAASTTVFLDYLAATVAEGNAERAAAEADSAAHRAIQALRLADAAMLLAFAAAHSSRPGPLLLHHGDIALALGDPETAIASYVKAVAGGEQGAGVERRLARAEVSAGNPTRALQRIDEALRDLRGPGARHDLELDRCRLLGEAPPATEPPVTINDARRRVRLTALAAPTDAPRGRAAALQLSLAGEPLANATELIETAVLSSFSAFAVADLQTEAEASAAAIRNPKASVLLQHATPDDLRHTFLHA